MPPVNQAETSADAVTAQILNRASGARDIWDFDGVVAHTEPLHEASYRELATRRHYRFADDFFSELVGNTEDWIWHRVARPIVGNSTSKVAKTRNLATVPSEGEEKKS